MLIFETFAMTKKPKQETTTHSNSYPTIKELRSKYKYTEPLTKEQLKAALDAALKED